MQNVVMHVLVEELAYRSFPSPPMFTEEFEDPCEVVVSHDEEDQVVFEEYSKSSLKTIQPAFTLPEFKEDIKHNLSSLDISLQPFSLTELKEVSLRGFYDPVDRYMDMIWSHCSYVYDFIHAEFHNCKNGQIVHFFILPTKCVLKDGVEFHFVIGLLGWLYWLYHIT